MKKILFKALAPFLTMPAVQAAGNETIQLQDIMGSPMEMLNPMLSEVRWLFGTVYGWAFLVVLICIAIAIIRHNSKIQLFLTFFDKKQNNLVTISFL